MIFCTCHVHLSHLMKQQQQPSAVFLFCWQMILRLSTFSDRSHAQLSTLILSGGLVQLCHSHSYLTFNSNFSLESWFNFDPTPPVNIMLNAMPAFLCPFIPPCSIIPAPLCPAHVYKKQYRLFMFPLILCFQRLTAAQSAC